MKTKIGVIEETIDALENDRVQYNWLEACSCNCGILAQKAMDVDKNGLANHFFVEDFKGSNWSGRAKNQQICKQTGLPMNIIMKTLFDLGFTDEDIQNTEFLKDSKVLSKIKGKLLAFYNKNDVITYLKAWVELLKEEQIPVIETSKIEVIKEKVVTKYVVIHPQILEDADTLAAFPN